MADCCGPIQEAFSRAESCPRCGALGQQVGRETVGAMVTLEVPAAVLAQATYRYCSTDSCPVVYYADGTIVERCHVRVAVNAKDPGPDVPLCYCFGHTRCSIAAEIAATGHSSAFTAITREVKAGHCACEVRNPTGHCCLGNVRAYENNALMVRNDGLPHLP